MFVNTYACGVLWIERIPLTRPFPPNHYYRNAPYLMSLSPRHGQESSHRDGTPGKFCVNLACELQFIVLAQAKAALYYLSAIL